MQSADRQKNDAPRLTELERALKFFSPGHSITSYPLGLGLGWDIPQNPFSTMDQPVNLSSILDLSELPSRPVAEEDRLLSHLATNPPAKTETQEPPKVTKPENPWFDPLEHLETLSPETREFMAAWFDPITTTGAGQTPGITTLSPGSGLPYTPQHAGSYSTYAPVLIELSKRVKEELLQNIECVLSLNPSRREALANYLNRLSGTPHGTDLRRWIEGPKNAAQQHAFDMFIEEVALFCLAQALLLKSWSDRGIRKLEERDIGHLNWTLCHALKPHVPPHREGWQITRPNLYSWYHPTAGIQKEIGSAISSWNLSSEGPLFLTGLLRMSRSHDASHPEYDGYDTRFFTALWEKIGTYGLDLSKPHQQGPIRRKWIAFTPTLRDGTISRTAPPMVEFSGCERNGFLLMVSEMARLWWGPCPPPLWMLGNALDVHRPEQLAMSWSSPKPTVASILTEMESCDLAFVLEERAVRGGTRTADGAELRAQTEKSPHLKRLRGPDTTLGGLQACIALGKLRPGGLLWWAREEQLNPRDGGELLRFLLEKGILLSAWDFSSLEHSLPSHGPLFPKFLYLFRREPDAQKRKTHHPQLVCAQGLIRSHVEVPVLLEEALNARSTAEDLPTARGQWKIRSQISAHPQSEWEDHWPDSASSDTWAKLEALSKNASPLGQFGLIRSLSSHDSATISAARAPVVYAAFRSEETGSDVGALSITALPLIDGLDRERDADTEVVIVLPGMSQPSGTLPMESLVTTSAIASWIQSGPAKNWLIHHCERRRGKCIVKEQTLKLLPIPNSLKAAMDQLAGADNMECRAERVLADYSRGALEENLRGMHQPTHAWAFARASLAQALILRDQRALFRLFSSGGQLRWKGLLGILGERDRTPFALHPEVQLSGSVPPHLPIAQIRKIGGTHSGFLLATETGHNVRVLSQNPQILEMLWDQLEGLNHPTWTELTMFLCLPRNLEVARATAQDLIREYGEHRKKLDSLGQILACCQIF